MRPSSAPSSRRRGVEFRGHSDTEVMVEGFAVWGVQPTIERLIGMFAFAVWDRSTRTLTLARDRLGIKPLYWGHVEGSLVFASELKALKRVPGWQGEIDRDALAAFLRYGYVPTPKCIYRGINKLAPGTLLECGAGRQGRAHGLLVACRRSRRAARPRRSMCLTRPRRTCSKLCSPTPCAGAWSPTCRSACSCPAASIPRRLRR